MAEPNLIEARIVELAAQPTVSVRVQQPMAKLDLSKVFDRELPKIIGAIQSAGLAPAGPPFGRYHQFGPDIVDVEAGFPVSGSVPGLSALADAPAGEIGMSELPGGPAATVVLVGPYDGLGQAYEWLHDWIHGQGRDEGTAPWESYASDPGATSQEDLRTELYWPLLAG